MLDTNANVIVRQGRSERTDPGPNVVVGNNNNLNIAALYGEKGCLRWFQEDPDVVIFGSWEVKRHGTGWGQVSAALAPVNLPPPLRESVRVTVRHLPIVPEFMKAFAEQKNGNAF